MGVGVGGGDGPRVREVGVGGGDSLGLLHAGGSLLGVLPGERAEGVLAPGGLLLGSLDPLKESGRGTGSLRATGTWYFNAPAGPSTAGSQTVTIFRTI